MNRKLSISIILLVSLLTFTGCMGPFTKVGQGTVLKVQADSSPPGKGIFSFSMIAPNDGWAVGGAYTSTVRNGYLINTPLSGALLHYNGTAWQYQRAQFPLHSIAMATTSSGWSVGDGGYIIHFDGTQWTQQQSPVAVNVYSVFAVSEHEAWAVGDGGTILHYVNGTWTQAASPVSSSLRSITMLSSSEGWSAGTGGVILHYENQQWNIVQQPATFTYDHGSATMQYLNQSQTLNGSDIAEASFSLNAILLRPDGSILFGGGVTITLAGGSQTFVGPSLVTLQGTQWSINSAQLGVIRNLIPDQQGIWSIGSSISYFDGSNWVNVIQRNRSFIHIVDVYAGASMQGTLWLSAMGGQIYSYTNGKLTLSYDPPCKSINDFVC